MESEPSFEEAARVLEENLKKNVILIVGRCWVDYKGRASSKLGPGERIILIKKDGALLVHRSKGYEPVNWMPGGGVSFNIKLLENKPEEWSDLTAEEEILRIKAVRHKPTESVTIFLDRILLISALNLTDTGEFSLYASEEDMQKAILIHPSLVEEGFTPITHEKKVEPGFVDVYGTDKNGRFVVVEIKRRTAGREAVLQLAKYVDSIKGMVNREVRGILVAPSLAKGAQRLLDSLGLGFKALSPKKCAEILSKREVRGLEEFFSFSKSDV